MGGGGVRGRGRRRRCPAAVGWVQRAGGDSKHEPAPNMQQARDQTARPLRLRATGNPRRHGRRRRPNPKRQAKAAPARKRARLGRVAGEATRTHTQARGRAAAETRPPRSWLAYQPGQARARPGPGPYLPRVLRAAAAAASVTSTCKPATMRCAQPPAGAGDPQQLQPGSSPQPPPACDPARKRRRSPPPPPHAQRAAGGTRRCLPPSSRLPRDPPLARPPVSPVPAGTCAPAPPCWPASA